MVSLYGVSSNQNLGEDFRFKSGSYSSFGWDINFLDLPVYRADTKEEFLMDATLLVGSIVTVGWQSGLRYAGSKLESDQ